VYSARSAMQQIVLEPPAVHVLTPHRLSALKSSNYLIATSRGPFEIDTALPPPLLKQHVASPIFWQPEEETPSQPASSKKRILLPAVVAARKKDIETSWVRERIAEELVCKRVCLQSWILRQSKSVVTTKSITAAA
jgi:hypothetical protein